MDLFKLIGTIAIDNKDANKALDDVSNKGQQTEGKLSKTFSAVGKGAAVMGKAVATGVAAGMGAVATLATKSIQSYADYEQLVGGVDTLFKNSSQKVQEYAANAYKTAGMSANEYMETVTSFSASLLQSLEGDTVAAAGKADMAITDMSDNANKMGTDISMIQTAYQGFAKQNYTMLDNLKLGYGGTKEEMQRLLEDAQKISGIKYDISSYADVVDAIHVMQEEMGIAGTTAKEASSTISGSIASMKGAWSNLLTAISSDDLPFDDYVNNFVDSVATVADNLMPRIEIALQGVVSLVDKLAPIIIEKIPGLLNSLLPTIIQASVGLINSLVAAFPQIISAIMNVLPTLIEGVQKIINALVTALPQIIEALVSALPTLIPMLIEALISIIVTLCTMLPQIIQPIIDYLPSIIISIVNALIQNLPALIQGLISLIMGIVQALPQIIQALVDALPQIIAMIVTALLQNLPAIIMGLIQVVLGIVAALPQILGSLISALPKALQGVWNGIKNVFSGLGGWFKEKFTEGKEKAAEAWSSAKEKFGQVWSNIKGAFSNLGGWFKEKFTEGKENAKNAWSDAKEKFSKTWEGIKGAFSNVGGWFKEKFTEAKNNSANSWSDMKSKFSNIKDGITNAFSNIKEKLSAPFEKARDVIKGVADKIKGFFKGEISMPKIKTPHFSIKPSGWKIGDLLKGSIPKLGIDWYAKAMNNPMVMDSPTIFGYNSATGKFMGGGEAGSEVVAGSGTLMNMIQSAVSTQNEALTYYLMKIVDILSTFFPEQIDAFRNMKLCLDTGALVGAIAEPMDEELGKLSSRKERGR